MGQYLRFVVASLVATGLFTAALAQDTKDQPPPAPNTAPAPQSPAAATPEPDAGNPNLSVATVKMDGGTRASKLIGASVTNSANQEVGTVNDLIMDKDDKVILGVISLGGILGVGGKLVAVPFSSLHIDDGGKVTLPNGSKDSLNKMPGFTYTN